MSSAQQIQERTRQIQKSHKVVVLLYHRIIDKSVHDDWSNIAVNDTVFRRQIELLDHWGYASVTFEDYFQYLEGKLDLPKKMAIITFDDAYEEVYTKALPILQEYGMRAVVFVVGDLSIRESIWDKSKGAIFPLLTENQIIELKREGFEIGSHSMTHPDLTKLTEEEISQELLRSRMLLEILLNSPIRSFAYPYGFLNGPIKKMAADAGYLFACGAYTGPPVFGKDYFEIRRIKMINSDNPIFFRIQLHPLYSKLRWIYGILKFL